MALWLGAVGLLAAQHVFWRDEVRALTIATTGDTVSEMFLALRGDGHPMLWYLLLRSGYALIGKAALPVISWLIGLAAVVLLIWRAPLSWGMRLLIVFGHFALWEYVVMARNYGISMLLMFVFAAAYPRWRLRGIWLVLPLALLANTNVHSMLLSWLLLGVWLLERWPRGGGRAEVRDWALRLVLPAGGILALASLACFLTVWPPFNDAAQGAGGHNLLRAIAAVGLPGIGFMLDADAGLWIQLPFSAALLASLFVLWGRPLHFLAALAGLCGMSLFFAVIYPGGERHQALWLVLLLTLWWMRLDADRRDGVDEPAKGRDAVLRKAGHYGLVALLLRQILLTFAEVAASFHAPYSRAADLGALIAQRPELSRAIIIADPDYLIEALPYYAPHNLVWQIRRARFGAVNHFTKNAQLDITLDQVTQTAEALHRQYHRPVLILLQHAPDACCTATIASGYNWTTHHTPEMARRFLERTRMLARYDSAVTDESYAVYLLNIDSNPPALPMGQQARGEVKLP
ncbi:hypothetical protein [Novosphingobium sp. PhB165]|uniref:hypothetical protein n=1 Tax=Novosphingobium sp. PhB165 TaxID=2485105 RepID=UPI00104DA518|nr:hypothetical protein [Novosphingobium sp. PhB165]